jgi:hypothetical protein
MKTRDILCSCEGPRWLDPKSYRYSLGQCLVNPQGRLDSHSLQNIDHTISPVELIEIDDVPVIRGRIMGRANP